jgi:hypothetical protein
MKRLTIDDLASIKLNHGKHYGADEGHCLPEVVSMFAGEAFSDHPACVDSVLAAFGMSWNDGMRSDDERSQLKQYVAHLVGTKKSPELSQKRGWMAMDWLVRVHCAAWLVLNPELAHHAEMLKSLPAITCVAELVAAQPRLDAARVDSRAAWAAARAAAGDAAWAAAGDAAWAAARAAAGDAAGAAAWAAAQAAAGDAAWAAAGDAAWAAAWAAAQAAAGDAAWAAAGDAAGDALEPTVKELQASAHDLFSRMIDAEE